MKRISSIGWLNNADGSIRLTPCIDSNSFPTCVNVSRDEFESIRGCNDSMKKLAAKKLGLRDY